MDHGGTIDSSIFVILIWVTDSSGAIHPPEKSFDFFSYWIALGPFFNTQASSETPAIVETPDRVPL